jgi:hypothetical protein
MSLLKIVAHSQAGQARRNISSSDLSHSNGYAKDLTVLATCSDFYSRKKGTSDELSIRRQRSAQLQVNARAAKHIKSY